MITPGAFAIQYKFGVSHTASLLPLSLFVLGLAIGPMLAAPISETRGRAIVYKVSMPLYMLFILGAGFSNSFAGLLVCRMLAAMAGAPCLAVGAGTVADLFEPTKMAAGGAVVVMAPFLGPCKHLTTTSHHRVVTNLFSHQASALSSAAFQQLLPNTNGRNGPPSSLPYSPTSPSCPRKKPTAKFCLTEKPNP